MRLSLSETSMQKYNFLVLTESLNGEHLRVFQRGDPLYFEKSFISSVLFFVCGKGEICICILFYYFFPEISMYIIICTKSNIYKP